MIAILTTCDINRVRTLMSQERHDTDRENGILKACHELHDTRYRISCESLFHFPKVLTPSRDRLQPGDD